eukprot:798197-Pelagomonas_calceolata.AAC.1
MGKEHIASAHTARGAMRGRGRGRGRATPFGQVKAVPQQAESSSSICSRFALCSSILSSIWAQPTAQAGGAECSSTHQGN